MYALAGTVSSLTILKCELDQREGEWVSDRDNASALIAVIQLSPNCTRVFETTTNSLSISLSLKILIDNIKPVDGVGENLLPSYLTEGHTACVL